MKVQPLPFGNELQLANFRDRIIDYVSSYERFSILDSGIGTATGHGTYRFLAGWGVQAEYVLGNAEEDITRLDTFLSQHRNKWIFGHIGYDVKNAFEPKLFSHQEDKIGFPLLSFFVAQCVCGITHKNEFFIHFQEEKENTGLAEELLQKIIHTPPVFNKNTPVLNHEFNPFSKTTYQQVIHQLLQHIHRGNVYEINYCLPFHAKGEISSPGHLWKKMQEIQQSPFGALYRDKASWLLCCSPERFLRKEYDRISSQPIKGTSARSADPSEDNFRKKQLFESEKERAENVMIVDLVRNDLGRIAATGSVQADELFGIYSFAQVHQMISTVSARLKEGVSFSDILKATFPMGSMTGAPKYRAMEIIEEHELFRRGLYSGSVGYIAPEGNFDFNVVIRSILYNDQNKNILFPAGSAITSLSDPEKEFNECLLKAEGMKNILAS